MNQEFLVPLLMDLSKVFPEILKFTFREKLMLHIIEVKCPFSAREMSIKDACANLKDFFLGK